MDLLFGAETTQPMAILDPIMVAAAAATGAAAAVILPEIVELRAAAVGLVLPISYRVLHSITLFVAITRQIKTGLHLGVMAVAVQVPVAMGL